MFTPKKNFINKNTKKRTMKLKNDCYYCNSRFEAKSCLIQEDKIYRDKKRDPIKYHPTEFLQKLPINYEIRDIIHFIELVKRGRKKKIGRI